MVISTSDLPVSTADLLGRRPLLLIEAPSCRRWVQMTSARPRPAGGTARGAHAHHRLVHTAHVDRDSASSLGDTIEFSRDAAATILVNGGAVSIPVARPRSPTPR